MVIKILYHENSLEIFKIVYSTGASAGTMVLSDAQEYVLLNGTWYYVIGTSANASGEIRGQITATAQ